MTNYQKKQNELFVLKTMEISKQWLWIDERELYDFKDEKVIPKTERGYTKLCGIVTPDFSKKYIQPIA